MNSPIAHAVLLSSGDELTLGQVVDTNSAWLSARLIEHGVLTVYHKTVPDDQAAIAAAIAEAAQAAELVLMTGGLGPTEDDLARQALAQALGCSLALHQPSLERIERFFRERGRPMPERNKTQAMRPERAEILDNDYGTAPGLKASINGSDIILMPGVPSEMRGMFECHILPLLHDRVGRVILTGRVLAYGLGESSVAEALGNLMARNRNPLVGTTVSDGVISIRIRSEFATVEEAGSRLHETIHEVETRLGPHAYGRDSDTLETAVGALMADAGKTLAVAESCTGGLLAAMLTASPGASVWFHGGWITYANDAKSRELGVAPALIAQYGAVSEQVAAAMAGGALRESSADFALAITGIAGPGGGTPEKPIGTVWIALAAKSENGPVLKAEHLNLSFAGARASIRERAARSALNLLRLELLSTRGLRLKTQA